MQALEQDIQDETIHYFLHSTTSNFEMVHRLRRNQFETRVQDDEEKVLLVGKECEYIPLKWYQDHQMDFASACANVVRWIIKVYISRFENCATILNCFYWKPT